MSHRALHVVERPDGRYDCYRSHWDALAVFDDAVTPERVTAGGETVVEAASVAGVLSRLDSRLEEALFVHRTDGPTSRYLVVSLRLPVSTSTQSFQNEPSQIPSSPPAVLVPGADPDTAETVALLVQTATEILGDVVDAGLVSQQIAESYLSIFLVRHPVVPDELLWIPQEVT